MNRGVGVLVAAAALVVASLTTAVVVTAVDQDGRSSGHRGAMMAGAGPGGMHGTSVSSEYAYLAEMVVHHEEAVMAARQLQRSDRVEMREFGRAIVASQSAQIDQMQQWLADWYPDRTGRVDYEPMMRDLTDLSGDRLDRAFLEDMIGHHMMAVMMSQQLVTRGVADHPPVEVLARSIRDEQRAEIVRMQRWLREWFGVDWHHGAAGPRMMR